MKICFCHVDARTTHIMHSRKSKECNSLHLSSLLIRTIISLGSEVPCYIPHKKLGAIPFTRSSIVILYFSFFVCLFAGRFTIRQNWGIHQIGAIGWRLLCNRIQRIQQVSNFIVGANFLGVIMNCLHVLYKFDVRLCRNCFNPVEETRCISQSFVV